MRTHLLDAAGGNYVARLVVIRGHSPTPRDWSVTCLTERKEREKKERGSWLIEGERERERERERDRCANRPRARVANDRVRRNTTCRVELHDYRPLAASAFVAGMQLPLLPRLKPLGFSSDQLEPSTGEEGLRAVLMRRSSKGKESSLPPSRVSSMEKRRRWWRTGGVPDSHILIMF